MRVERVADVSADLGERGLPVHRDDQMAAELVGSGVVDHGAAERLDQHVQVSVARTLFVDAEAPGGADDVAPWNGPTFRSVSGRRTRERSYSSPMSSTSSQGKFLFSIPRS
jgi:hypothetical protein